MEYIYINDTSLSKEICEDIIFLFEKNKEYGYEGITGLGINKNIKDTWDITIGTLIEKYPDKPEWKYIHSLLSRELYNNLKIYLDKFNNNTEYNKYRDVNFTKFKIIENTPLKLETFQIQKYEPNIGKYIYHNDSRCELDKKMYRVITYLWYLNDVNEGGETEFFGSYKIKPKTGKLVLFPATWTYPHCAMIPISEAKYIITGWIYIDI
jgi:hypothetical protein